MENPCNKDITELLPHRKPFLFIDKVLSIEGLNKIVAQKKINTDDDYFKGHFPGNPIVPGVLIVESMAQASGIICAYNQGEAQDIYFLSSISNVRFRHPVFPGDTLTVRAEVLARFGQTVKTSVECVVNNTVVAEGELVLSQKKGA